MVTAPGPPARLARHRRIAAGLVAVLVAGYGVAVGPNRIRYIDHDRFRATARRMRGGEGFYRAFRDAYLERGMRLGGPRSFREPLPFLVWRWIPDHLLYPTFLVVVVGVTCLILLQDTDRPYAVLPVALFLLVAGRNPAVFHPAVDGWLLVEFWAIPLLAGCRFAWRRSRWGLAAGTATAACLVRELALPVLVVGLVMAHHRGKPRRPWIVGLAVAIGAYAVHVVVATHYGSAHGNEAKLLGSAHFPMSIAHMLLFNVGEASGLGTLVWAVAILRLRRPPFDPTHVLLLFPLFGLLVDRPYWALMAAPFVILAAGEATWDVVLWIQARIERRDRSLTPA